MKRVCLSVIVASLCVSSTFAQEGKGESVYKLGRVEVVAKEDISQNRAIDIVDAQTIKDTKAITVVEALQSVPGVYSTYSGGRAESNIRVRGFASSRVPVFIDGIPVYVPYDKNMDLGRFKTYDVAEISVSKGYVSPIYGPNTMGGAVNIITKKPVSKFEGEIGAGLMNGEGREIYATIGSNQDIFYALLSASSIQREYYKLPKDFKPDPNGHQEKGKRNNSEYKDKKINLKLGLTPNDTDEYSFNFIAQRGDKEQPWATTPKGGVGNFYKRNWYWPAWDKTSYYVITQTAFGEHYLKTRLYYDKFYNKMISRAAPPSSLIESTSQYDDNSRGAIIEGDIRVAKNHLLKLTASQKYDNHKDIDSLSPGADVKNSDYTTSLGGEYSWKINDTLTWIAGIGWDKNSVQKAYARDNNKTFIEGEHPKHSSSALNLQTAIYTQISDDLMVYGSFSRKSNMPSMKQRYSSRFGNFLYNPDLKAERSTTYEVGSQYSFLNVHLLKGALFYTTTDDYISTVKNIVNSDPSLGCTGNKCSQSQNFDKEKHLGLELSFDSQWSEKVSTYIAYTYIDAKIKRSANNKDKYVTDVPKHSFYASAKYSPLTQIDIAPALRYESKRFTSTDGSDKSSSYTLADLRVAYRPIKNIEIGAGVKNILDKYYYFDEWFPQEGRSYYMDIKYTF